MRRLEAIRQGASNSLRRTSTACSRLFRRAAHWARNHLGTISVSNFLLIGVCISGICILGYFGGWGTIVFFNGALALGSVGFLSLGSGIVTLISSYSDHVDQHRADVRVEQITNRIRTLEQNEVGVDDEMKAQLARCQVEQSRRIEVENKYEVLNNRSESMISEINHLKLQVAELQSKKNESKQEEQIFLSKIRMETFLFISINRRKRPDESRMPTVILSTETLGVTKQSSLLIREVDLLYC